MMPACKCGTTHHKKARGSQPCFPMGLASRYNNRYIDGRNACQHALAAVVHAFLAAFMDSRATGQRFIAAFIKGAPPPPPTPGA